MANNVKFSNLTEVEKATVRDVVAKVRACGGYERTSHGPTGEQADGWQLRSNPGAVYWSVQTWIDHYTHSPSKNGVLPAGEELHD